MTETMTEEVNVMCNLSKGVWEEGRRSGIEEGRRSGMEAGRRSGMEEGRKSEKLENIRSLMQTMKLSSDQAMQALQIPESEQPKYEELLKA